MMHLLLQLRRLTLLASISCRAFLQELSRDQTHLALAFLACSGVFCLGIVGNNCMMLSGLLELLELLLLAPLRVVLAVNGR